MGRRVIRYKEMVRNSRLYEEMSGYKRRLKWKLCKKKASQRLDLEPDEALRIVNACCPKPVSRSIALKADETGMEGCDLSVIIPVYNVEEYLRQCLDSVLDQRTSGGRKDSFSFEIIAVNDGATDGSGRILEEYEKRGIRVVRQENRGLSGARNTGIDKALGKYLMFLDSDDYLQEGCLERLMRAARENDAQIAAMDYVLLAGGRVVKGRKKEGFVTGSYKQMCLTPGFAWGKVYDRKLFDGVRFPENYWYEDTIVHLILMKRCRKMVFLPIKGYVYRSNEKGISYSQKKSLRCLETYWVLEEALRMAGEAGLEPDPSLYGEVLDHLTYISFQRIKRLEEKQLQAVFLLSCVLAEKVRKQAGCEISCMDGRRGIAEKTFARRDYGLWKLFCECAPGQ